MERLVLCPANYVPLTPVSFISHAEFVYGERVSIIHGNTKYTWKQTHDRCIKLASALSRLGIKRGDVVAVIAPNIPALYELHFAVPMTGAILSAFNTKLNAAILALKLQQLEAKLILVDYESIDVVQEAFAILEGRSRSTPSIVVLIHDNNDSEPLVNNLRDSFTERVLDYDEVVEMGEVSFKIVMPRDECDPISVNFTSGSTGEPKGVVYSHRAVYLNSIAQIFRAEMRQTMPVFLWTVDMFRCNGWCFPWTMAALGGTNICLREATGEAILHAIAHHKVTHFCGPPALLTKMVDAMPTDQQKLRDRVNILVAGTMPPSQVQIQLKALGYEISHGYGMTEALSVITSNPWSREDSNENDEDSTIRLREGTYSFMMEGVDIKDPKTMESVPADGKTIGEIRFKGNTLMLGYLNDAKATREAFEGGWYRTRDLGVRHPNGCIEFKDRVNDIIKCGGETISTLDVEAVLIRHPMVLEAAVVGKPHHVLGETPCAFVKVKEGVCVTKEEIIKFCSCHLPNHMIPQSVVFGDLAMNSTGKIQKYALREKAVAMNGY